MEVFKNIHIQWTYLKALCVGQSSLRQDRLLLCTINLEAFHDIEFCLCCNWSDLVAGALRNCIAQLISGDLAC